MIGNSSISYLWHIWMRKKRLQQAERAEIALATDLVEFYLMTEQCKQLVELHDPRATTMPGTATNDFVSDG